MPIIKPRIRFIEKFLTHFNCAFSTNHQRTVFREFIYGLFSDYKRLSLAAIANNTHMNYQRLQYFFSESNWSTKELNDIRIRLLQNQRTTKANNHGVLAIDDTACPKPYAEKTEGAGGSVLRRFRQRGKLQCRSRKLLRIEYKTFPGRFQILPAHHHAQSKEL